ncbi:hypothetical protein SUNI508_04269 [Seiridium unicorne]|uniref:DUF2786 domain-containing protein n=1 Tax=Seiridium unicorne TaxID=138068 RepID=A0ABR2VA65_9PEZI
MDTQGASSRRKRQGGGANKAPTKKRAVRSRAPPKLPPPVYKATIKELAETGASKASSSAADVDSAILLRIKKCLDRANHPNTPEAEAKAAFHIGSRLMGQYNVSQAEVLAHESASAQKRYAGQSVVSIVRFDGDKDKTVRNQGYNNNIYQAMATFFDCKLYTLSNHSSVDITFYGIAENTVAAAMAFEMAYNLIAEWSRAYKGTGSRNSYCHGIGNELYKAAVREKEEEEKQATEAESEARAAKARQEEAHRAAELSRLAPVHEPPETAPSPIPDASNKGDSSHTNRSTSPSERTSRKKKRSNHRDKAQDEPDESDYGSGVSDEDFDESDEDDAGPDFTVKDEQDLDLLGDLDKAIEKLVKPEPSSSGVSPAEALASIPLPPKAQSDDTNLLHKREKTPKDTAKGKSPSSSSKPLKSEAEIEVKWASHSQLVVFRETATKIADDYIEDAGLKLRKPSRKRHYIHDVSAYTQGKQDSKKIDVRRKRGAD